MGGGWEGEGGRQPQGSYHVEETFMEQLQQYQAMAPQLVHSRGAILLTVTSQGQQNALQESRPVNIGQ